MEVVYLKQSDEDTQLRLKGSKGELGRLYLVMRSADGTETYSAHMASGDVTIFLPITPKALGFACAVATEEEMRKTQERLAALKGGANEQS